MLIGLATTIVNGIWRNKTNKFFSFYQWRPIVTVKLIFMYFLKLQLSLELLEMLLRIVRQLIVHTFVSSTQYAKILKFKINTIKLLKLIFKIFEIYLNNIKTVFLSLKFKTSSHS